jgi:hypothetical protein
MKMLLYLVMYQNFTFQRCDCFTVKLTFVCIRMPFFFVWQPCLTSPCLSFPNPAKLGWNVVSMWFHVISPRLNDTWDNFAPPVYYRPSDSGDTPVAYSISIQPIRAEKLIPHPVDAIIKSRQKLDARINAWIIAKRCCYYEGTGYTWMYYGHVLRTATARTLRTARLLDSIRIRDVGMNRWYLWRVRGKSAIRR